MSHKRAKKIRKETRRRVDRFLANIFKLSFRHRIKIAWRIAKGK